MTLTNKFGTLLNKISDWFISHKLFLLKSCIAVLLFTILIVNSGYTLTYIISDTFYKTLIIVVSFLVVGIIFVLTNDFSKIVERFKTKKPSFCFIALCIFGFSTILTMLCTSEIDALIPYAAFGLRILCAFMIAKLFNLKRFISIFQTGLLIITLIAIAFYIAQNLFGITLTPLSDFSSFSGTVYHNYFFLSFQNAFSKRMQGPFWEPGLFATYLLLGLAFEIIFYKRIRLFYFFTFFIGIILTQSTFGYLLLLLILVFLVNKKINNIWIAGSLYISISLIILSLIFFSKTLIPFLAKLMPVIFSKMVNRDGSISFLDFSRYLSPSANVVLWLKSPVWGNGLMGADTLFETNYPGMAQTSTMTFYLTEFGIFGLAFTFFFFFGLWKQKSITVDNKLILTILFLFIFNKEPHTSIIFEWVLLFLFLKEGWDKDTSALAFDPLCEGSIIKSFSKKDNESVLKRNISVSFAIKGLALVLGFFSYPLYRKYFNNDDVLGIWLTVISLMSIIISLDFGLGNGLKNKMTEALVKKDIKLQKQLVSSSYIMTAIVSAICLAVTAILIYVIDLNSFLKIDPNIISPSILKLSTFFICLSLCLELILKNVNSLLQAKQKQALSSVFALISTACLMLFAALYKNDSYNNLLLTISVVYIFTINVPLVLGSIFVFTKDFKGCFPSFKCVTKETIRSVGLLGMGFFIIQILLLLINSTSETFISSIFGSSNVVQYTNYNKPFSIIYQLFSIVTLPYWAMVVKQKEENDTSGIKKNLFKLLVFCGVFVLLSIFLSVIFQPFINLWLGKDAMKVNYFIIVLFNILIIETMVTGLLSVIANGLSIIKQQVIFFGIAALIKLLGCVGLYFFSESTSWYFVVIVTILAYIPLIVGEIFVVIKALRTIEGRNNDEKQKT